MTTVRLMRSLLPSTFSSSRNAVNRAAANNIAVTKTISCSDPHTCISNCRCFAQVIESERWQRDIWFSSSAPRLQTPSTGSDHKPPDERTLQLGKTVRVLHERLPTLLKEPLPSEILSPSISLHLFPSTHPHLPTVSGRIAYIAALWTAPVAWGRMPLIGNVKLSILSERMVRNGGSAVPLAYRDEKLIVKWKTSGKPSQQRRDTTGGIYRGMGLAAARDPVDKIKGFIAGTKDTDTGADDPEEFCGIFVFEFDERGRIVKHTIEHTDEGDHWDRMTRVVSVTDWLLGHFNGKKKEEHPALAWCEERPSAGWIKLMDRRQR